MQVPAFELSSSPRTLIPALAAAAASAGPAVLIPPRGGTPFADAASHGSATSSDDDSLRGGTPEPLLDEVFVAGDPELPPLPPPSPVLPPPPLPSVLLRSAAQGSVLQLLTRANGPFNGALVQSSRRSTSSAAMGPKQTAQFACQCIVIGKYLLRKGDPPASLLYTAGASSSPPAPALHKGHRYRSALWLSREDSSNYDATGEYLGEVEPVEETSNARALGVDGCSCSRSHCTSRHCECKKAGRRCDPRKCFCQGCENCPAKKKRKSAPV